MSDKDTIVIMAPKGTKARWVRQSQAEGAKLTDWVIKHVEASAAARKNLAQVKMNVFKIPDALTNKYHGAGYALAATANGQLVDLVYLGDALPDFGGTQADAARAVQDDRIAPVVRELQALGSVHVGMCSCWEFVSL